MDEQGELNYERGSRAAWLSMLGECLRHLGYDDQESQKAAWIKEREETVAALRSACDECGDNEWPYDLHLADVVKKHLVRHLNVGLGNEIPDVRKFVEEIAVKTNTEFRGAVSMFGLKTATEMFIGQRILEISGIELPDAVTPESWLPKARKST